MTIEDIKKIEDAKQLLSDDTIDSVFDEQNEVLRARLIIAMQDKSKELNVKGKFDLILSAYKKMERQIEKNRKEAAMKGNSPPEDNFTEFDYPGFLDNHELACGAWVANQSGVVGYDMMGKHIACYHPILITKTLTNAETGREKVRLAFCKGFQWREITIDKGMIASATKIVGLADFGVSVTSESAKLLVRFLSDIENLNMQTIERGMSTSKFGWLKDRQFSPYDDSIEFDAAEQFKELCESLEPRGSFDGWKKLVLEVRQGGRYEPRLYMAAAFASILLKPLNILPFIVNVYGTSGGGKTVSIMMATSIWASPSTEHSYMADPTDTLVGFERKENTLNHLPLVLDDLSKTRDKYADGFTDLVYMICSGRGKGRSNVNLGLNKVATWQNVCLTSMERPLATETMRGGAINRIIDCEMDDGGIFKDGNRVVSILNQHYGWAGEKFVRIIQDMNIADLKAMQSEFLKKINAMASLMGDEKEEKQTIPLSVILTADKIATDQIFQDGIYLDIEKCVKQLKSKKDVLESERAYDFILSDIAVNMNKYVPDDNGNYRGECWGMISEGYAIIIRTAFTKICERGNFSDKMFLQWAKRENLIQTNAKGDPTKPCRFGDSSPRCVWLKMERGEVEQNEQEKFIKVDENAQNELPFS